MREPTEAEVEAARRYWAEVTGERFEDVPWEVVFVDCTAPTAEEEEWARKLVAEERHLWPRDERSPT